MHKTCVLVRQKTYYLLITWIHGCFQGPCIAGQDQINAALQKIPTTLAFQVDEASKRFIVNVSDISTGERIRQIPGDAVLRIARQLESLKGIIFDDKY